VVEETSNAAEALGEAVPIPTCAVTDSVVANARPNNFSSLKQFIIFILFEMVRLNMS
jgi:hypothetical protein